ncbi:MAG: NADP-dependent phosphogluconate dehydrogenase [Pseudomonadota bacterium]
MAQREIGLVGLGTMGAALALNIAEKGVGIAVWNRDPQRLPSFMDEAGPLAVQVTPAETLEGFVAALAPPRAIILMVPAGAPVDQMIAALRPLISPGDLIVDGGNSDYHDTDRRAEAAGEIGHLGLGVSGGEQGARHGPSMMAGGDRAAWDRVAPILTAIAARHEGQPCATWFGPGGAGHFVKTVHNGIEYADMQIIAEVYGILRDGMGFGADQVSEVFGRWNEGRLSSYLIEITAEVAGTTDPETGQPLLDIILDVAAQKGTGRWTAIEAQHLGAPIPVIEAAVAARNVSARHSQRQAAEALFGAGPRRMDTPPTIETLEAALTAGKILCYSQGFDMLDAASRQNGWGMALADVARVWRAGCIIRSAMLDDMAAAFEAAPDAPLMLAPHFAAILGETEAALRAVVGQAVGHGIAVPALSGALAYFDAMRTGRGTANLIQGQRDFFGLHSFVRADDGRSGQHGPWAG